MLAGRLVGAEVVLLSANGGSLEARGARDGGESRGLRRVRDGGGRGGGRVRDGGGLGARGIGAHTRRPGPANRLGRTEAVCPPPAPVGNEGVLRNRWAQAASVRSQAAAPRAGLVIADR